MEQTDFRKQCSLNGMPCHAYIVKKLTNECDMLIFEKSYVDTMLSFGFEHDNIETSLYLFSQKLLPESPVYGKSFDIRGEGIDAGNFIDSLCIDVTIPRYESCQAYYRTYDEYCTACQICMYSPFFKNVFMEEELLVLRFAFQSAENLQYLKQHRLNATCFKSVYDVLQSHITASGPKLFPFHKILYKLLNKSLERYFHSESAGFAFDYKLRTKLADELSSLGLPSAFCTQSWYEKQVLVFEEQLFSIPVASKDEISRCLKQILSKEKYMPPKISKIKPIPDKYRT